MRCITPCILNGNACIDRGIPPPYFSVSQRAESYRVPQCSFAPGRKKYSTESEFVKEFPVLCDMRADYKGNKNKKKDKIWD
jgi:hypothetical protein